MLLHHEPPQNLVAWNNNIHWLMNLQFGQVDVNGSFLFHVASGGAGQPGMKEPLPRGFLPGLAGRCCCQLGWGLGSPSCGPPRGPLPRPPSASHNPHRATSLYCYWSRRSQSPPSFKRQRHRLHLSMGSVSKNLWSSLIHHDICIQDERWEMRKYNWLWWQPIQSANI